MKKSEIYSLVQGRFLEATAHCLPADEFYKWYKFRRQIMTLYNQMMEEERALYAECGITFGSRNIPPENRKKFLEVYQKFLEENVTIDISGRIPFSYYKDIYDENKVGEKDVFSNVSVESLVLDQLFEQP